ncbi:hypothetical protein ANN_00383 [Periplaneta americana]|uniref:Uncharacterized protein n=1 Tax=Periplaneta americana TaxID=6978 RepID=A0ABQ8TQM4_PERAM|nr:hypothetical protein ANN_00383 [Periplaneta americana]
MAADGDCHHLCNLMAPVRHRWSINDVIGGIRNTVMPSDCSPTLTLREEQRLRVFENKVLRKIFGAKRDEVTGEWRKLHNAELHTLYSSPDIIRNIKSRRLRWAGHVARMGESRNAYRVLVGRPEGKRPLGRPRRRWEDNIKMDLREVGYDDRDWINLAQDRDQWRAYVRAAMNLRPFDWLIKIACSDDVRASARRDVLEAASSALEPVRRARVHLARCLGADSSGLTVDISTSAGRGSGDFASPQLGSLVVELLSVE